jgi:hypothetical protein
MQNVMWGWCGVNHDTKTVYFNAWEKLTFAKNQWVIVDQSWRGINGQSLPGMTDALNKLDLVLNQGYKLGLFLAVNKGEPITPENSGANAEAVEIDYIKGSFYFESELLVEGGKFIASATKRVNL